MSKLRLGGSPAAVAKQITHEWVGDKRLLCCSTTSAESDSGESKWTKNIFSDMLSANQSQLRADLELLQRAPGKLECVLPNPSLLSYSTYSAGLGSELLIITLGKWYLEYGHLVIWPVNVESRIIWTGLWCVFTHGKLES